MDSIQMEGRTWILFPLNKREVRELARLGKSLKKIQGQLFSPEPIDISIDIVFTALTRNYPELTKEQLEEWLDLNNIRKIAQGIMHAGGFTRSRPLDS